MTETQGTVVVAESADTLASTTPINPPVKGKGKNKATGAPDYANMSPVDLIAAWEGYVTSRKSDGVTTLLNTEGTGIATELRGELATLASVAIGLRKAYGRGVKRDLVAKLLPGITIPENFNPTFGLFLSACRLRPDDAAERKVATEVRSALRARIRKLRSESK